MKKVLFLLILFFAAFINVKAVDINISTKDATVGNVDKNDYVNVDLIWGNMNFIYYEDNKFIWNNVNNDFELVTSYYWKNMDNSLKVTNFSSKILNINLSYKSLLNDISGKFNNNNFVIKHNENIATYLELFGSLNKNITDYTKIGIITIDIN